MTDKIISFVGMCWICTWTSKSIGVAFVKKVFLGCLQASFTPGQLAISGSLESFSSNPADHNTTSRPHQQKNRPQPQPIHPTKQTNKQTKNEVKIKSLKRGHQDFNVVQDDWTDFRILSTFLAFDKTTILAKPVSLAFLKTKRIAPFQLPKRKKPSALVLLLHK